MSAMVSGVTMIALCFPTFIHNWDFCLKWVHVVVGIDRRQIGRTFHQKAPTGGRRSASFGLLQEACHFKSLCSQANKIKWLWLFKNWHGIFCLNQGWNFKLNSFNMKMVIFISHDFSVSVLNKYTIF